MNSIMTCTAGKRKKPDCRVVALMRTPLFSVAACLFLLLGALGDMARAQPNDFQQVAGLIDLRTTYSDGELDLESLVLLAKERGFQVVIVSDHDRVAMEYGLFPLRNLIKKKVEQPSVNQAGAKKFLAAIQAVNQKYPDMLVIPGVESSPFYYWTGNPFTDGLTAHDWERHLLVIGLASAQDYETLPLLHNEKSGRRPVNGLPVFLLFLVVTGLGILILFWRGPFRPAGVLFIILGLLFAFDSAPFWNSPFDPYHGPQDAAPYQMLIDDVNAKGGLTFWNHPETLSGVSAKPPIRVETRPYPEMLLQTDSYTGFATVYGDIITVTEPGNLWDRILLEYCQGFRANPIWGIATADYHSEKISPPLGAFPTVFLVQDISQPAILNAMKKGRMYAVQGAYTSQGILDYFEVMDPATQTTGISGDEIEAKGPAVVRLATRARDGKNHKVTVRIIRGGELVQQSEETTPFSLEYQDNYFTEGEKTFFRIDIRGGIGSIVANPIFVQYTSQPL